MGILQLGILISGSGSTAQAIYRATEEGGELHGKVELKVVIANKNCSGIEKFSAQGVPTAIVTRKGKSSEDFGKEILTELKKYKVNFVSQNGWLPLTPANVVAEYKGKIINQHPGPLNKGQADFGGKGMYGINVHAAKLLFTKLAKSSEQHKWTEVVSHFVSENFDEGDVIHKARVEITKDMLDFDPENLNQSFMAKAKLLQEKALPHEHKVQIETLAKIASTDKLELPVINFPWLDEQDLLEEVKTKIISG